MCKISIVTVCYNAERSIKSTIESVLKQTYTDYEYILIDGKSTDNTYKIVCSYDKKFKNRGVQYRHISEQDQGIFDAMNKGIQMARGRYINFMNADDKFHDSEVLETLFANQELDDDVIYGNTVRVSRDEKWMTKADPGAGSPPGTGRRGGPAGPQSQPARQSSPPRRTAPPPG